MTDTISRSAVVSYLRELGDGFRAIALSAHRAFVLRSEPRSGSPRYRASIPYRGGLDGSIGFCYIYA